MRSRFWIVPLLTLPLVLTACGGTQSTTSGGAPGTTSAPAPATLSNPVIASSLAAMARQVRTAASASAAAALSNRMIHVNDKRQIQVYIHVAALTPELLKTLSRTGATDIRPSEPLGVYQAWVSPAALAKIATLSAVTRITPPVYGFTRPSPR